MKTIFKITSLSAFAVIFNACVSSTNDFDLVANLPAVSKIKTLTDMRQAAFEWEPVNDLAVDGFKIFRSKIDEANPAEELIASIPDRYATHFVDASLQPEAKYLYTITTFNKEGISQPTSVSVQTAPKITAVPFVQAITGLPNKIKLIWRPHPDLRVVKYRVYKQSKSSEDWRVIATVKHRLSAEYIDNIKPNEFAKYRISAVSFDGIESQPSEVAQAVSKTLPPSVSAQIATDNLPKKILLTWDAPAYDDFDHFNIYVKKSRFGGFNKLAESKQNSFEDVLDDDGIVREYYVTMVDSVGLESPRPQVNATGMSLARPAAPVITHAGMNDGVLQIIWRAQDSRAKSYVVLKNGEQVATTPAAVYEDPAFSGKDSYQIIAVDEFNIASEPSKRFGVGL